MSINTPSLSETAAVLAALDAYAKALSSEAVPLAADVDRLLAELAGSIKRVQAVTR